MNHRRIAAAVLGCTLCAGAVLPHGSSGSALAATSLASLVINKADVPAGYKQVEFKADTIQQAADGDSVSVAALRAKGWIGDFVSQFQKGSTKSVTIASGVSQFKGTSGASWELTHGIQSVRKQYPGAKTFAVHGMGDQAVGLSVSGKSGKVAYAFNLVAFRSGKYVGIAAILSGGTTVLPTSATHYAGIVYSRVENA